MCQINLSASKDTSAPWLFCAPMNSHSDMSTISVPFTGSRTIIVMSVFSPCLLFIASLSIVPLAFKRQCGGQSLPASHAMSSLWIKVKKRTALLSRRSRDYEVLPTTYPWDQTNFISFSLSMKLIAVFKQNLNHRILLV